MTFPNSYAMMLVFCWQPTTGGLSTVFQAGEYMVQRDGQSSPNWLISLVTPTSTSVTLPQLVIIDDKLHLTNGVSSGNWNYRCRFEGRG